jgi:hypothetical protein
MTLKIEETLGPFVIQSKDMHTKHVNECQR